ncbi:MAG TPA: S46 family peptidase [Ignavibacteriaceae bacterium]|nr:S46 family peptidase [Ignavibacteriaceae bacterium]
MYKTLNLTIAFILVLFVNLSPQSHFGIKTDTVKAQKFDMGKMWTFESFPFDFIEQEYGFTPSDAWLEKMQKAALKFGGGCSGSFVSEDGLIMTNHHCIRNSLPNVNEEGEDILLNGFYAPTLETERKMPGLKVEQMVFVKDVSDEVLSSMSAGKDDAEKIKFRNDKIEQIKNKHSEQNPGIVFRVTSLYNGGKFSLYGYKIYDDIRLVFVPELWTAKLGGDYDNFTYPRYGLDCAFFRAYENGKPIKADYYFTWNMDGVIEDQPVFVVGNPGTTERINTMAQIEFARDVQYPMLVKMLKDLYDIYEEKVTADNAQDMSLVARLYSIGNALKVYEGTYRGLLDPFLIARKKDFEKTFRNAVNADPELMAKYSNIWDEIADSRKEAAKDAARSFAYQISNFYSPRYLFIARDLVALAKQLQLPEDERDDLYIGEELETTIESIFPENFNKELNEKLLLVQVKVIQNNLPPDDELLNKLFNGKKGEEAVKYLLSKSKITNREDVLKLAKSGADAILNSDDPFIYYILNTQDKLAEIIASNRARNDKETIAKQQLGEALYKVYGESIPPDATFTIRIADGIVKGYDYNGTRAPIKTTFYGALDRYYSFDKKFPFNLPDRFENLPAEFNLSAPLNFISTNDIVGGNSGSAVLNIDAEVVGLAFDGNIESLPNNFIYTTEANRTVSVSAVGMIEAINNLYNAKSLSDEIINGKRK